ncbi:MAG: VWA domain-containing protein [Bdellovibrionales bacterium]|nr:VWA domain-containing protein [Bdellovibrionales bacterium]
MNDWHFAYPWIFYIAPILLVLPYLRRKPAFQSIPASVNHVREPGRSSRGLLRTLILPTVHVLLLLFLTLAAARPQRTNSITLGDENRRNIMLALDVSRSMDAPDFISPDGVVKRITGVKSVTKSFIEERTGDRIGLVLFGTSAFLQSPLTIDHVLLASLVNEIRLGVAGDGTAMGDGLGVALKRIEELPSNSRAIILLTDGVSNSGRVEPLKAAKIAARLGVKVYTIGIGSKEGSYVQIDPGMFGARRVRAEFDEATLVKIADLTGGKYFFASDMNELDLIYREIDQLESTRQQERSFTQTFELAPPLLLSALLLFLIHYLLSQTVFRVVP